MEVEELNKGIPADRNKKDIFGYADYCPAVRLKRLFNLFDNDLR